MENPVFRSPNTIHYSSEDKRVWNMLVHAYSQRQASALVIAAKAIVI